MKTVNAIWTAIAAIGAALALMALGWPGFILVALGAIALVVTALARPADPALAAGLRRAAESRRAAERYGKAAAEAEALVRVYDAALARLVTPEYLRRIVYGE